MFIRGKEGMRRCMGLLSRCLGSSEAELVNILESQGGDLDNGGTRSPMAEEGCCLEAQHAKTARWFFTSC